MSSRLGPNLQLLEVKGGLVLRLLGPWDASSLKQVPPEVTSLELNYSLGWRGGDLDFLHQFPGLQALRLISYGQVDLEGLSYCRQLKALDLGLVNREHLNLAELPELEDCRLTWQSTYSGLEACTALKRLWLSGMPSRDADVLATFPKLVDLSLASSPIQNCEAMRSCPDLTFVGLYHCRKLNDISALGSASQLRWLEIMDCRSIRSIDPIAASDNLEHVELIDCGNLESLSPLFGKQRLQHLLFYGETNVKDGRLSSLLQLPNLSTVAFKPRPHYNVSPKDFRSEAISNPQPPWRIDWWADIQR